MPKCQNCAENIPSEELIEHPSTRCLLCFCCSNTTSPVLDEGLNYEFSYSKKHGIKASASLGSASIRIHVPQEELIKVLG